MGIREGDKQKTAFQIRYGYFKYQVMSFGLSNASANFQGYVNKILVEKLDVFVIVYLDNILIHTKNASQSHVEAVYQVFRELQKHNLFANLKQCHFYQEEIYFLSYVISSQRIFIEEKRINTVKTWPKLKSIQDIQIFIGFANFYWHFIQGFSKIAVPFTLMLKTSSQPASALPAIGVDISKVVSSNGKNDRKLAKSNFTKPVRRAEKPSFLTPNAK